MKEGRKMTNTDKYLKEGVSVEELAGKIHCALLTSSESAFSYKVVIKKFFNAPITPKLTEDERVILRNIDKDLKTISRYDNGLYLHFAKQGKMYFYMYNHLFQFIKERRRILNRRIIERRIKMNIFKMKLKTTNALGDTSSDIYGKNYIDLENGYIYVSEDDIKHVMKNYEWEIIEKVGILYQRPTELLNGE